MISKARVRGILVGNNSNLMEIIYGSKGKEIEVGAPIKKGSKIDLYIGKRESDYDVLTTDSTSTPSPEE